MKLDYLPEEAYDEAYSRDIDLKIKHAHRDGSDFHVKIYPEGSDPIYASHYREDDNGNHWITLYLEGEEEYSQATFMLQDVKVLKWEKKVKIPEPIPEEELAEVKE